LGRITKLILHFSLFKSSFSTLKIEM